MIDKEIKIFLDKVKRNPLQCFLLLGFAYKLMIDVTKRKVFKKKNIPVVIPKVDINRKLEIKSIDFINKYVASEKECFMHFTNSSESDKLDEQFIHYKERFYDLLFVEEENIETAITNVEVWIANNPLGKTVGFHPYTVSERIVNWCIFLSRFEGKIAEKPRQIILLSIYEQSEFLFHNFEHHLGHHNHLINNSRALLYSCALFREEDFVTDWKKKAMEVIDAELKCQVLEDGVHAEQSTTYHFLLTRTLWELKALYQILNETFPYKEVLEKMMVYATGLVADNQSIPLLGHTTPDFHWKELAGLVALWTGNPNFKSSAYSRLFNSDYSKGIDTIILEQKSVKVFSKGGIGIIKDKGISVCLSNDPLCDLKIHGDQMQLGIVVIWDGTAVIRDCGLDSYNLNPNRKWFESWQGQSCCVINETNPVVINWRKNQLPSRHYRATGFLNVDKQGKLEAWHTCYNRLQTETDLKRTVGVADEGNVIEIVDTVTSKGTVSYQSIFHFGLNQVVLENGILSITDKELNNVFYFQYPSHVKMEIMELPFAIAYGEKLMGTSVLFRSEQVDKEGFFCYKITKYK
jgi:hypothetical protein